MHSVDTYILPDANHEDGYSSKPMHLYSRQGNNNKDAIDGEHTQLPSNLNKTPNKKVHINIEDFNTVYIVTEIYNNA